MKGKIILSGIATVLGMGLEKSSATLPVLLTIDVSNPSAVTITATGWSPFVNDNSMTANDGVDLLGFFNVPTHFSVFSASSSTLIGGSTTTLSYNLAASDDISGSFVNLNLYSDGSTSDDLETFSITQPAFTGSLTLNFSSRLIDTSVLPSVGSQGDIQSGYGGNPGNIIGSWQVVSVPEPGTGSLVILASAIGLGFKHRRARKNLNSRA